MMKKRQFAVMLVALWALVAIMSCASQSSNSGNSSDSSSTGTTSQSAAKANPDIPDWYLNPPEDPDYIYGIGTAKMANTDRSRRAAEHRARTSLAFQLNSYVKAMEIDYGQEAGTTNDKAVVELFENVDRQLAAAALSGASVSKRFVAPDGTQYALISYPRNSAKDAVKGIIENAASRNAVIKKDIALKDMEKAFAEISSPQPVDSGE
jgi:hypothetical protein